MNHNAPTQPDMKQFTKSAIIAVVSIILVVGLALFITSTTGRAGAAPVLEPANLSGDDAIDTRPLLLNVDQGTHFDLTTDTVQAEVRQIETFTVTLTRIMDNVMTISLDQGNNNIVFDTLYMSGDEPLRFYLNDEDAEADLEVSFAEGLLTMENLNFIPGDSATINLMNMSGSSLPSMIRLAPESQFNATMSALGELPPALRARILIDGVQVDDLEKGDDEFNDTTNLTTAVINWTVVNESTVAILEITATVQGKETVKYYTLAIGDTVYAKTTIPKMQLTSPEGANPSLLIMFDNTTELQPLGLPCNVNRPLTDVFAGKPIERIYTFRDNAPAIWTSDVGRDFNNFERFEGYFVKLSQPVFVNVTTACTLDNIQPGIVPGLGDTTHTFAPGWHIISMPGHVPQPLSSFTHNDFTLVECDVGEHCAEIPSDSVLDTGRAYWINAEHDVNVAFR